METFFATCPHCHARLELDASAVLAKPTTCPHCNGKFVPRGENLATSSRSAPTTASSANAPDHGQHAVASGADYLMWTTAAMAGGLVGAAAWAAVTYFTEYEIGWIAWGIGAVVGLAVGRSAGGKFGVAPGVVAAAVAVLAVLGGKLAAASLLLSNTLNFDDPDLLISCIADEVVEEFHAQGQPVRWPPNVVPSEAVEESEYPEDVWAVALVRWQAMTPKDREDFKQAIKAEVGGGDQSLRLAAFLATFSAYDLLWVGLAAVTAFKLGSRE